jgi:hypothetical protein
MIQDVQLECYSLSDRIDDEIFKHTMKTFPELAHPPYDNLVKLDEDFFLLVLRFLPDEPLLFIILFVIFTATIAAYLIYISAAASGAGLASNVDQELPTKEQSEV